MRLELSDIYRKGHSPAKARERLEARVNWARAKCERRVAVMTPLDNGVQTIGKNLEGTLAYGEEELSTAFLEGLNRALSGVKRAAHGCRNTQYMMTMP